MVILINISHNATEHKVEYYYVSYNGKDLKVQIPNYTEYFGRYLEMLC